MMEKSKLLQNPMLETKGLVSEQFLVHRLCCLSSVLLSLCLHHLWVCVALQGLVAYFPNAAAVCVRLGFFLPSRQQGEFQKMLSFSSEDGVVIYYQKDFIIRPNCSKPPGMVRATRSQRLGQWVRW